MNKMKMLGVMGLAVLIVTMVLPFPSELHAQSKSTTATLSGTVADPSGARVPKATVRLTNPENGIIRTDATTDEGEFSFAFLPAGTYVLEASALGFRTTKQTGIVLSGGDTLTMAIGLTVGATEQVTVNAGGPLLQTQDANISTEISSKQVEELPLNLRNVLSFATLDSAVNVQGDRQLLGAGGSEDTADQDYSFLNFGGGYFGTNLFLLEGGYDVAQGWGGILYVPAPEDTDQVKVTSYSFSAQYGFSTGNVISLTTKAGNRDYHFLADELPSYQLSRLKFDHTDIRFTTNGETLYAIALGWPPDNRVLIKSLASTAPYYQHQIGRVELLGSKGEVKWTRESTGLRIEVPQDPPCHYAYCFKILPTSMLSG